MKTRHEVAGRRFSLESIRKDHLSRMDSLGLLRRLDVQRMSDTEVEELAEKHGSCPVCL